jgi:O-antigen/teichoic acid export membrane protein
MTGHSLAILRNLKWTLPAGIIDAIVKAGAVILLARLLGPAEFGLLILVLSIVAVLGLLSDAGISAATARLLSEAPERARSTMAVAAGSLLVFLVLAVLLLLFFADWLADLLGAPQVADLRWIIAVLLTAAIGRKFAVKFFEGLGRVDLASKVTVAVGWAPWLLGLALVLGISPRATWALAGHAAGSMIILGVLAVVLTSLMRSERTPGPGVTRTTHRQLIGYALPMVATAAGFLVYTQVDVILVQYFLTTADVGVYGTAVRLLDLFHVPAAAVGASVAVFFVKLTRTRPDQAARLFELVTTSILLLYLPVGVFLLLFASELIAFIFGPVYLPAGVVVAIYVPFLLLKALSGTYSLALDYLGFAFRRAVLVTISAVANVALNMVLIPRQGIVGAAVATQITYLPLALYYMWLLSRETGGSVMTTKLGRISGAAVASGAFTWLVGRWASAHVVALAGMFLVLYLLLLMVTRAVTEEDRAVLFSYVVRTGSEDKVMHTTSRGRP